MPGLTCREAREHVFGSDMYPIVRLPQDTHPGEQDCSTANALMHARVSDSCMEAVQRALARAAAYEAADCLQPTLSLPLIAQRGEEDCTAVNTQMHGTARVAAAAEAVQQALVRAAAYEAADCLQPSVSLPLIAQRGEEDCTAVNAQMYATTRDDAAAEAVQRGLLRAAEYEAADCLQPAVSLPLIAQRGEEDCRAIHAQMHAIARGGASLDAVQRGLTCAAAYESFDGLKPPVALPSVARQGEQDCSVFHAQMHAIAQEPACMKTVQRALARAAEFETADRLEAYVASYGVKLATDAHAGDDDCSAANALMHARVLDSACIEAVQRGLARAAEYEAADCLQPSVSLPLIAQHGEEDCTAVNAQVHVQSQDLASLDAALRGLLRAAEYEAADCLQPAVSLPLIAQRGEEDCRAVNAQVADLARDAACVDAVQRGLQRAAAYEAADCLQPTVSLPHVARQGEKDCSATNALMHARATSGVRAVLRGLARAGAYEMVDLLEGLEPNAFAPSVPNPLQTLSVAFWQDMVSLSASLESVEVIAPHMLRMHQAQMRERERQLLRMGSKDQELLRTLSAHLNGRSCPHPQSYSESTSAIAQHGQRVYATQLTLSTKPVPKVEPAAFNHHPQPTGIAVAGTGISTGAGTGNDGIEMKSTFTSLHREVQREDGTSIVAHHAKRGSARAPLGAALPTPSSLPSGHPPPATSSSVSAKELRSQPSPARPPEPHNKRKHARKNGKLHKSHDVSTRGSRVTCGQDGSQRATKSNIHRP